MNPVEAVAQAIREHQFISWPSNGKQPMCCLCQQGCSGPDGYMLEMDFREHAEHVAAAVLASLKPEADQLASQWDGYCKYEPDFDAVIAYGNCAHELRSLVSSWTSGSEGCKE